MKWISFVSALLLSFAVSLPFTARSNLLSSEFSLRLDTNENFPYREARELLRTISAVPAHTSTFPEKIKQHYERGAYLGQRTLKLSRQTLNADVLLTRDTSWTIVVLSASNKPLAILRVEAFKRPYILWSISLRQSNIAEDELLEIPPRILGALFFMFVK